jgi:hypothetical protein
METLLNEYVAQMSCAEKIAYDIAKSHLESSFDLKRSIGFQKWLKNKNKDKPKD